MKLLRNFLARHLPASVLSRPAAKAAASARVITVPAPLALTVPYQMNSSKATTVISIAPDAALPVAHQSSHDGCRSSRVAA